MEKEGKDLPLAFTLSIFSGFLFERSLSLDIYQVIDVKFIILL